TLSLPATLIGEVLRDVLKVAAHRGDTAFFEQTLHRCSVRLEGLLHAGREGTLTAHWTLPAGLETEPAFRRTVSILLAGEIEARPLSVTNVDVLPIPPSKPGRVTVTFTLSLYDAEKTLSLPVTAFAENPYIVGSPIEDPRDFHGRIGLLDDIVAALE